MVAASAASAISFCASSPAAVVLTVWPSGTNHLNEVRRWIAGAGAQVVHEQRVPLTSEAAELLTVMAIYDGEEWVESNCWYMEQPLPSGPPTGPYAGAKWKRALCFRNADRQPHAMVLDVSAAGGGLWSSKYGVRRRLAELSGNPGNSCIHLTDEQSASVLAAYARGERRRGGGGMSCDDSYAYVCSRALLHPHSVAWLNSGAAGLELGAPDFRKAWARYCHWLHAPPPPGGSLLGADGESDGEWAAVPAFATEGRTE